MQPSYWYVRRRPGGRDATIRLFAAGSQFATTSTSKGAASRVESALYISSSDRASMNQVGPCKPAKLVPSTQCSADQMALICKRRPRLATFMNAISHSPSDDVTPKELAYPTFFAGHCHAVAPRSQGRKRCGSRRSSIVSLDAVTLPASAVV